MREARAGAGVEIEEQLAPKRAQHHAGSEHLIPAALMAATVEAAARLGPAGEGDARRDRAGKAPRHRAHHGGKITYTGSLGRNGREKRNTVPRTPTKSYQCSVVSETVSISLRRRQSLGGNGKLFVRCSELECQHIDTNEPPCPLTLALFEAEIAERMAQRAE